MCHLQTRKSITESYCLITQGRPPMTEKQIESAEDHYNDFPTYPLQPCFGTEYEAGTMFCENCRDKKECWVKMETGSTPVAIKPNLPSICEYEKRWETRALAPNCTERISYTLYVNYTCGCVYCAYPGKECNVKRV